MNKNPNSIYETINEGALIVYPYNYHLFQDEKTEKIKVFQPSPEAYYDFENTEEGLIKAVEKIRQLILQQKLQIEIVK